MGACTATFMGVSSHFKFCKEMLSISHVAVFLWLFLDSINDVRHCICDKWFHIHLMLVKGLGYKDSSREYFK